MLKQEFHSKVAKAANITRKDVEVIMNVVRDVVLDAMKNCDEVKLFTGLTLSGANVEEAARRNPRTGEDIVVPAHIKPKAKFSPLFKNELNV